eukprot:g3763.t1
MRARDIGVSVVAVTAAFLALQGTPDVNIQLHWYVGERPLPREGNLPVPLPLVTDLDGDGKNEVVVLADGGMEIRVLSVPAASGETLVDPWILHKAELDPNPRRSGGKRRAVALAAGYVDPPLPTSRDPSSSRPLQRRQKQRVVVVREDLSVVCYDHELRRLWNKELKHEAFPGDFASYALDQVAMTVTHSVRKLDDRGQPKGRPGAGTDEGLVVIGVSFRHRDGRSHHTRAGNGHDPNGAAAGGVDPLGVHVEPFIEGEEDSRDDVEEAEMSKEERVRRAAEHFSLFALDVNNQGALRWRHRGGAHHADVADAAAAKDGQEDGVHDFIYPGLGGDLFRGESPGAAFESLAAAAGAVGRGGGRRYRRSLLRHLPHAWSVPSDTRLEITALRRKGPGDGSHTSGGGGSGSGGGGGPSGEDGRNPHSPGRRRSLSPAAASGGVGGAGGVGAGGQGGGVVRAVLARTREGLEAVELATGRPLSAVALPWVKSGAGVFVDLNGDGVVDHVQAVGARGGQGWGHLHSGVAMGHLSDRGSSPPAQEAQQLPPCYALAVSGLPPREQLFNGSLCHNAGALYDFQERLSKPASSRSASRSRDIEVGTTPPAVLQRVPAGAAMASAVPGRSGGGSGAGARSGGLGPRSDVVFAVSSGVVSSYDDEGRLNWQDRRGPVWAKPAREGTENAPESVGGYVVPFVLETGKPVRGGYPDAGTSPPNRAEERILVVGQVELFSFMSAPIESQVVVDNVLETKLQINFNMSFLDLPCEYLTVDALDVLGSNRVNITGKEVQKWHLDPQGVKQAFHGRNRQQKDILQYDEGIKVSLQDLHKDGVHAVALTEVNFDIWLEEHDLTFVAFHAPWCSWCQRLMPTLEVLAEVMQESGRGISVATVDCTVFKQLCTNRFNIRAFPTLKLFRESKLQTPDYHGDRTVDAFSKYLYGVADGVTLKHQKRGRKLGQDEVGLHDDKWPGCMVTGHIKVNRVPGNFHIEAASKSHTFHGATTNLSHIVHHMSFGVDPPRRVQTKINRLPEDLRQNAPMDGNVYIAPEYHQAPHHYIRVVGSSYQLSSMKKPWHGYQAVANSQMMLYDEEEVPEARFAYNISPMSVLVRSEKRPFYDFATKVLAIVGGTFSVVGLVDAAVFRASRKAGRQLK